MPRILIIDDDEDLSAAIGSFLESAGYEVALAQNGRRGIRLCEESKFDLVISDILMPEADGLEFIFTLRKANPQMPIIAMSGGGQVSAEDYLQIAAMSGVSAVIRKPFGAVELLEMVKGQIAASTAPDASASSRP